ncbi:hypothetical protein [Streptomyces sp. NBC_00198]|uniref:hypothetical protein n=1 Tax=Streptomyces sp. NBC_00198 TaxID=2975677 RepID=UPI00224FB3D6|nr:hypothetical protein [Streptomyces sp. NBC_00198]MCX5285967.1 hypothetical protein [Streptomyces sp. NBC_00198]MCX5286276.1 hypothetical protein [Streptomyces sp. NBC_00198]
MNCPVPPREPAAEITPAIALQVLAHYDHPAPGALPAESYPAQIVACIDRASYDQSRTYAAQWPAHYAAVHMARNSPTGIDTLQAIVGDAAQPSPSPHRSRPVYPDYSAPRLEGPYLEVHAERTRQTNQLGHEDHQLPEWVMALVEHVGNLAQTVLDATRDTEHPTGHTGAVRAEALQVAAAGMALIEHLDRAEAAALT